MTYRKMKRQPRAKAMLPAIKKLIAIRSLENRDKDRTLLAYELIEEIQDKFPKEITPTKATLIKKISEARSNYGRTPLDKPWNLAELDNLAQLNLFNIDAEAIDYILKVQQYSTGNPPHLQVSIRQAKWISRLFRITKQNIKYLWFASYVYANYEIICEIADIPLNTRKLDANLYDIKAFYSAAQKMNEHELANEAFKKGFYYNINRYYSEIEEVI